MSNIRGKTADVVITLPSIFSDHMVLQRGAKVPIWGKADGGASVLVTLADRSGAGRVGIDGKWMVWLDLRDVGVGPFEMVFEAEGFRHIVSDVVVGEVWLASGQSNMQALLRTTTGADSEIERPANSFLRQFRVPAGDSPAPQEDCKGSWVMASPETAGDFSGVGYHFARRVQGELGIPVGILLSSRGATPCEGWISRERLCTVPELREGCERLEKLSTAEAEEDRPLRYTLGGSLFNAMIHPVCPYGIRGVIWYQGESNAERAWQYRVTFPMLIADWRARWRQGDFPFYFCQLANYQPKEAMHAPGCWPELREAQSEALAISNTAMAVLVDVGEADNIHPLNKKDVGERLAAIALARDYGRTVAWSGPIYQSMSLEGSAIRIYFDPVAGGLVVLPSAAEPPFQNHEGKTQSAVGSSPESRLEGFSVCGVDQEWVRANTRVEGDSVVVWSADVPAPVAVRYAWEDNPVCNLGNAAGLPASPFRTDNFPALTRDVQYGLPLHS